MSISVSVSVGYQRRRPSTSDRWEQRLDSLGLLLVGTAVVVALLVVVLPRIFAWLSAL